MNEPQGIAGWLTRPFRTGDPVVPVVRLHGVITAEARPGRLNIQSVAPLLDRAFRMKGDTVAIIVNSPGGSPVQSRLIAKRIRDLATERGKHVLVFVEDAAASGGYFPGALTAALLLGFSLALARRLAREPVVVP